MNDKTPEQLAAEEKAVTVIESCENHKHFNSARNYIDLFHKKFQDTEAYTRLWKYWKKLVK